MKYGINRTNPPAKLIDIYGLNKTRAPHVFPCLLTEFFQLKTSFYDVLLFSAIVFLSTKYLNILSGLYFPVCWITLLASFYLKMQMHTKPKNPFTRGMRMLEYQ